MFELFPPKALIQALKPYALSPVPNDHTGTEKSLITSATGLVNVPGLGLLSTSLNGAMDAAVVFRTWGLTKQEPSLQKDFYGPSFTYQEFQKARNILTGMMTHYGLIIGAILLLCSLVRALIRKFIFEPGDGPYKDEAKKDCIEFRAIAKPDSDNETNKQAFGKLSYTGSMYYREWFLSNSTYKFQILTDVIVTAVLLAQGAATILQDDAVKLTGGIYTPACLGQGYMDRLENDGVHFETEI
jgi:hypothetical protein